MTFSITIHSIRTLCPYAEFRYAICHVLFVSIQNVIMLSVIMLNVVMLIVIMLNVVVLSDIMLSVVTPHTEHPEWEFLGSMLVQINCL
jgi:hypothetical protein